MPALTIAWEYLTGYAVATDPGNRERAEWPPHPARVFMALAAAWFETDPAEAGTDFDRHEHDAEGAALAWLETLGDPEMWLPSNGVESERSLVTVYVPVNDKAGPSAATLQSAPALTRSKQARTFPRRHVGRSPCALHWQEARDGDIHHGPLDRLSAKVTRIGHSSSLVRMWVVAPQQMTDLTELERWHAHDLAETHCRRVAPGLLRSLQETTGISRIERFAEAIWRVEDAQRAAKKAKDTRDSTAKKAANAEMEQSKQYFQDEFGEPYKKKYTSPVRLRPSIGLWTGYRRRDGEPRPTITHSHFDTDLLILTHENGPRLPLSTSLRASEALRGAIIKHGSQSTPSWISGHETDGKPSEDVAGHLALLPLPFVGAPHADGHLLGMALAFPRDGPGGDPRERGRELGPLLVDQASGVPTPVNLTLGRLGVWTLRKREWSEPRRSLQAGTWTAQPAGATCWASVTPVVLDRFPKADRRDPGKRPDWEREVRAIIAEACARIGLPAPVRIDIGTTSWHTGSPRAIAKQRRLRERSPSGRASTALGDGFPAYPPKGSKASRPQVHVWVQFAGPVLGPVLLGAGRYRGYGLCKPWKPQR